MRSHARVGALLMALTLPCVGCTLDFDKFRRSDASARSGPSDASSRDGNLAMDGAGMTDANDAQACGTRRTLGCGFDDAGEQDAGRTRPDAWTGCASHAECADHVACNGVEQCAPNNAGADSNGCISGPAPVCPSDQPCVEAVGGCACGPLPACRVGARCDSVLEACFGDSPAWSMPSSVRMGLPTTRSYSSDTDTVTDLVTGLVWQRLDGGRKATWTDALNYCSALSLGGNTDWRLPTLQEWISLVGVDASATTTSISYYFDKTETGRSAWTATPTFGQTNLVWAVGRGVGYGQAKTGDLALPTRCVRGTGKRVPAEPRFSTSGGVVTDSATGLRWTETATKVDFSSYGAACANKVVGSVSGWRLPEFNEIASLYDPALGNIITAPFPALAQPASPGLWIETGGSLGPDVQVSMQTLSITLAAAGDSAMLLCVR